MVEVCMTQCVCLALRTVIIVSTVIGALFFFFFLTTDISTGGMLRFGGMY